MELLTKAAELLLALTLLVGLHELGHFWAARFFKIRVEKFYLFFDFLFPLPNVLKFSIFKKKIGDTEWGLGWFPMGGYVQIAGMMDENMDKETLAQPAKPDEFRSKPAWQRLIVMIGGVTVNLILGMLIYMMILFVWGEKYLPMESLKYGIYADSLGRQIGLQNGDKITGADGKKIDNYEDIVPTILINQSKTIQYEHNGAAAEIAIPTGFIGKLAGTKGEGFIDLRRKFIIEDFGGGKSSAAAKAGFKKGDEVVAINDSSAAFYDEVHSWLETHKNKSGLITVKRGNEMVKINFNVPDNGKMGVSLNLMTQFDLKTRNYTLMEAIPAGVVKSFDMIGKYIKGLNQLFKSFFGKSEIKATDSVGGFISIGSIFPYPWNWELFWNLTAMLSLVLAVMNLLPIPALDGGHVIFCLYEMITGRKPNDKVLEYAQYAGMIILLSLLVFVNGNDIYRYFFK